MDNSKKYLGLLLLAIIATGIFIFSNQKNEEVSLIVNPASVFCVENGGKSSVSKGPDGDAENCTFDNGQTCDSWALYRGECNVDGVSNTLVYRDANTSIEATFRGKTNTVILNASSLNLNYLELKPVTSASGDRYSSVDGKIEFWQHQEEASVSVEGKNVFTGKIGK